MRCALFILCGNRDQSGYFGGTSRLRMSLWDSGFCANFLRLAGSQPLLPHLFVSTECPGGRGLCGIFEKPLKRAFQRCSSEVRVGGGGGSEPYFFENGPLLLTIWVPDTLHCTPTPVTGCTSFVGGVPALFLGWEITSKRGG